MKYENGALSLILKIRGSQQTGGWKYVKIHAQKVSVNINLPIGQQNSKLV
jgi:hypothetical protein